MLLCPKISHTLQIFKFLSLRLVLKKLKLKSLFSVLIPHKNLITGKRIHEQITILKIRQTGEKFIRKI